MTINEVVILSSQQLKKEVDNMNANACYYGLYSYCAKRRGGPDFQVCADCITNTVTHVLRATYTLPSNGGVTAAVKQLLQRHEEMP